MAKDTIELIDVLICVGYRDIDYMLEYCIKSCLEKFQLLNNIHIVTNEKEYLLEKLRLWEIDMSNVFIHTDFEVLNEKESELDGWYRQQLIKLYSNKICDTRYICCLGADTIILKNINKDKLFYDDKPIIYFNRYNNASIHLEYERMRVNNISKILKVIPYNSYLFGDFIMDLMIFDSNILEKLHNYLGKIYGEDVFLRIITDKPQNLMDKSKFGEWSMYAIFILDCLKLKPRIDNSRNKFVAQLHSFNDLSLYKFDSYVAHFVNKDFDKNYIINKINALNL